MFSYYLALGARALSRNPLITALMIILIAVGVAGSVTTFAILSAASADPLPTRSKNLFVAQIDNRGPNSRVTTSGDPDPELTYRDAVALRDARLGARQSTIYPITLSAIPVDPVKHPFAATGYAVNADFFSMFGVPFQFGGPWNMTADREGDNDVVIGSEANQKLFEGKNSVGMELRLGGHAYRVSGVLRSWNPLPRFYALSAVQAYNPPPQIFVPFQHALDMRIPTAGSTFCAFNYKSAGWEALIHSECSWISLWVELPAAVDVARFNSYLTAYSDEQRSNGRFQWPSSVRLHDLNGWLKYMHVVPPELRISFIVALGLLLVCAINTVGLLLARFMSRAPDIGLRRALGATQGEIYRQYLTEAGVIGLMGGLLGTAMTYLGVVSLGLVFEPKIARTVHVEAATLSLAVLLAIAVALCAAAYPVWRASRIQPGWQLKGG
ncbi:MAG: putative transport system permease protein [Gammaproteobacteria bacterium]|nr:putative transport system permease protein [Gammaproteobacteria bacterium]